MHIKTHQSIYVGAALLTAAVLAACSGGGGGGSSRTTGGGAVPVTGTVLAPGGQLAFNAPTGVRRLFAGLLGANAYAAIAGTTGAAGVTVNLIEIDVDGNQVGQPLATAITDGNGNYSLDAPAGFTPSSRYVVRAEGASGTLDAMVTGTGDLVVDPVSHVTARQVIATASDLAAVSVQEIQTLREEVSAIAQDVNPSGLTLSSLTAQVTQAAANDEELGHMLANSALAGGSRICGQVIHQGNPHAGIRVVVRDYAQWVTRARTATDGGGNYCVDIAPGDYIVGALNATDTSFGASEWWSQTGDKYQQIDAEKVTVAGGTTTASFDLETGGRIEGDIAASGGLYNGQALEGINVEVRDFRTDYPAAIVKTDASGHYRVNVINDADGYIVNASNRTWRPYASQSYTGAAGGSSSFSDGAKITATNNVTQAVNFALVPGNRVTGRVLDQPGASGGQPVTGMRVRVNIAYAVNPYNKSGPAARMRTGLDGRFGVWLKPDTYTVQSYGQQASADLTSANVALADFEQTVGKVAMVVKDGGGNPVSQAKLFMYDTSGNFVSQEVSYADGSTELYAPATGNYLLEARIDDGRPYGSTIYNGKLSLLAGTDVVAGDPIGVTAGSTTAFGDLTLPASGILRGTVYLPGDTLPAAGVRVQVRYGGTDSSDRFVNVWTRSDGSYEVSLPAATYNQVRAGGASTPINYGASANNVGVAAGATTTRNFTLAN